jgi:hypothetical protein
MGIWQYFCFWYRLGLYSMQEFSYLGKITLVSIWFRRVLTQIISWVYQDSFTLTYPPNISIWLALQFWDPLVGSLWYQYQCWLLILCIHLYIGPTLVKIVQVHFTLEGEDLRTQRNYHEWKNLHEFLYGTLWIIDVLWYVKICVMPLISKR